MQNSFEESIKKQLTAFTISPKKEIWDEIDHSLDANSRKKVMLLWLTLGLVIIGLSFIGYEYYFPNNTVVKSKQILNTSSSKSNQLKKGNTLVIMPQLEKTSNTHIGQLPIHATPIRRINSGNRIKDNKGIPTIVIKQLENESNRPFNFSKQMINRRGRLLKENKSFVNGNNEKGTYIEESKDTSRAITAFHQPSETKTNETVRKDIVHQNGTLKQSIPNVDSISVAKNITNDSIVAKPKRGRFVFMVGSGEMKISSAASQNSNIASTLTGTSGSNSTAFSEVNSTVVPPKNGITFKLGVGYQWDISTNWQFETGLKYLYIQNKQPVGLQKDSVVLSDDGHYFQAGSHTSFNNYAHLIQLPIQIKYVLNPYSSTPFHLLLGGSIEYQFQNKWLVAENSNAILYYKKSLTNKLLSSGFIGFGILVNNRIGIDVIAEKAFASLQVNTINKNLLQIISLNLSIPTNILSLKKSKK